MDNGPLRRSRRRYGTDNQAGAGGCVARRHARYAAGAGTEGGASDIPRGGQALCGRKDKAGRRRGEDTGVAVLVCSLGSSSKGNAFLIEHEGLSILVDAGFAVRELANRLQTVGVEPQSVSAIFVTHEHIDHIGGVRRFAERFGACVFSSPAIRDCVLGDSDVDWRPLAAGEPVEFE
ncbi:MAG TPA: MBL fold metallo-hydrolase, partial [Proteobacteria bacterium]|nr:MBL fold metallo-hydrolase [Pseudomonadota bacterium]